MMVEALEEKLPRDAIRVREQAGQQLTYIETWYAIQQANRIFGYFGWDKHIHNLHMVDLEEVEGRNGPQWRCYYTCHMRVHVRYEGVSKYSDDVGYGSGISKYKGDAIESASKEAVSDAVKRCLKDLGNQFGLALYDKEKSGVETREEAEKKKDAPPVTPTQPPAATGEEASVPLPDRRLHGRIDEFNTPELKGVPMRDLFWRWLQRMQDYKAVVGEPLYREHIQRYRIEKSNQVDYTTPDGQRIMCDLSARLRKLTWMDIQSYYNAALVTLGAPNAFFEILAEVNPAVEHGGMITAEPEQRALVLAWAKKMQDILDGKVALVVKTFDGEVLQG